MAHPAYRQAPDIVDEDDVDEVKRLAVKAGCEPEIWPDEVRFPVSEFLDRAEILMFYVLDEVEDEFDLATRQALATRLGLNNPPYMGVLRMCGCWDGTSDLLRMCGCWDGTSD